MVWDVIEVFANRFSEPGASGLKTVHRAASGSKPETRIGLEAEAYGFLDREALIEDPPTWGIPSWTDYAGGEIRIGVGQVDGALTWRRFVAVIAADTVSRFLHTYGRGMWAWQYRITAALFEADYGATMGEEEFRILQVIGEPGYPSALALAAENPRAIWGKLPVNLTFYSEEGPEAGVTPGSDLYETVGLDEESGIVVLFDMEWGGVTSPVPEKHGGGESYEITLDHLLPPSLLGDDGSPRNR